MYYGILKQNTNTGSRDELAAEFCTPLTITNNEPELGSDTVSLKRVGAATGHQRWEVTSALAQSNSAVALMMALIKAGRYSKIYIRMPALLDAEVAGNVPVQVGVSAPPGSNTLQVSNASPLKEGVFMQLEGHPKVYMITGKSGNSLTLTPPLRAFAAKNTSVIYGARVTMHAKVDDNIIGIKYENGIVVEPGTYKFVEAL